MKASILVAVVVFFSMCCFGKQYTLSNADFIYQFSGGATPERHIYCTDKKGEKVWLFYNDGTLLSVSTKSGKKSELLLYSVKYKNGEIEGVKYNALIGNMGGGKVLTFHIDEVESLGIKTLVQASEYPYYNLDSVKGFTCAFNDSVKKDYASGSEWVIKLIPKDKAVKDTFAILTNACYHISFKDNNRIQYGVVMKITQDSLYISNSFNANTAAKEKLTYKVCAYPVKDISVLALKATGRFPDKIINTANCDIAVVQEEKANIMQVCWYSFNPVNGEARLYRAWLTADGFTGIGEQYGHAVWYER